jgi:hypothetical protein
MIRPIRKALEDLHPPTVWVQEYRSGYGIADLVGMVVSDRAMEARRGRNPSGVNSQRGYSLLALLHRERCATLESLARRTALSSNSLQRMLRMLVQSGLAVEVGRRRYRLTARGLNPASEIIAVEAKIEKWSHAILQARRYLLFADRTYVAITAHAVKRVDRAFLYRHRVGLIGVNSHEAYIVVPAPRVRPRSLLAHRACAERLFSQAI